MVRPDDRIDPAADPSRQAVKFAVDTQGRSRANEHEQVDIAARVFGLRRVRAKDKSGSDAAFGAQHFGELRAQADRFRQDVAHYRVERMGRVR